MRLRQNASGQKVVHVNTFLLAASKSCPFANFSILYFDGSTGTNSSFLSKITFILEMIKFTIISSAKDNTFTAQISFILGANCRYIVNLQNIVRWFTSKHF